MRVSLSGCSTSEPSQASPSIPENSAGKTRMNAVSLTSIEYLLVTEGMTDERCFSFETRGVIELPDGTTTRRIFEAAIERAQGTSSAGVLNDLFRYLSHGNFAGRGVELDRDFPFQGTIPEGRGPYAAEHLSHRTNTVGSALHLLMTTKASAANKALLGSIVSAMARHPKYAGTEELPVFPVIAARSKKQAGGA